MDTKQTKDINLLLNLKDMEDKDGKWTINAKHLFDIKIKYLKQGYGNAREEVEKEYDRMLKGDWTPEQLLAITYLIKQIRTAGDK